MSTTSTFATAFKSSMPMSQSCRFSRLFFKHNGMTVHGDVDDIIYHRVYISPLERYTCDFPPNGFVHMVNLTKTIYLSASTSSFPPYRSLDDDHPLYSKLKNFSLPHTLQAHFTLQFPWTLQIMRFSMVLFALVASVLAAPVVVLDEHL
jgi:hypothetical protein